MTDSSISLPQTSEHQQATPLDAVDATGAIRVSVVIPVFNGDRYITQAIASVLNQTLKAVEIIVVDDGSTDQTRQIVTKYNELPAAENRPPIHYLYQENQGVAAARNRGIKVAKGEFIAFLDADDYFISSTKLADQLAYFDQNPHLGLVQCGWQLVDEAGHKITDKAPWQQTPTLTLNDWVVWKTVLPSALMLRRHWLQQIGGFDNRFPPSEDVDLVLRLALAGCECAWLPSIAVGYRQHGNNATSRTGAKAASRIRQQASTLTAVLDEFFAHPELPTATRHLQRSVYHHTFTWMAWCFYRCRDWQGMAQHLRRSAEYATDPAPLAIAHWLQVFTQLSQEEDKEDLDIHALTQHPTWQELVGSVLGVTQGNRNRREGVPDPPGQEARHRLGEEPKEQPKEGLHVTSTPEGTGVSVIIPVYNDTQYIGAALDSVLQQTCTPVDIIVVDDGSTEDVKSALAPYWDRIQYVYKENGGAASARNRGLEVATGQYVAFLDADDFWVSPTTLAERVRYLEANPHLGMVHSGWRMVQADDTPRVDRTPWEYLPRLDLTAWVTHMPVFLGAMLFRRDWINQVGGFDPQFRQSEDVDLTLRLALEGCECGWLKQVTVAYRQHSGNTSGQSKKEAHYLNAVLDQFFTRSDLPDSARDMEPEVRYWTRLWLAWNFYRAGEYGAMADYLHQSLMMPAKAATGSVTRTVQHWVESFSQFAADYDGVPLDVSALTSLPEWRSLVTSSLTPQPTVPPTPPLTLKTPEPHPPSPDPSPIKLNLTPALQGYYGNHRSGLLYALDRLRSLHHDEGILIDAFVERKFAWDLNDASTPYREPWIGFIHTSPAIPDWWDASQNPKTIFQSPLWQQSLPHCQHLFCLSEHLKHWLQQQVTVPVSSLILPTETPELKFSIERFRSNPRPKVIQVGWWLRKLHSIYYLPVHRLQRAVLYLDKPFVREKYEAERHQFHLYPDYGGVETIPCVDDAGYDQLLSENLVYMELYDSCSNNAIVECIVRNTPLLVNPLAVVVEYLGPDYPLYFETRQEAAAKAENLTCIEAAHEFLKHHPLKPKLTAEFFYQSFVATMTPPSK